jgi:hypothetical protein
MFKQFINNWHPFYAPPESSSGGATANREMSKEDIYDALGDDSDDNDDKGGDDESDDLDKDDKSDDDEKPKTKDKKKDKEDKKDKSKSKSKSDDDDDEKSDDEDEDEDDDELDLDALEEDLKEPTDDDLELVTPVSRAKILKKYPALFKDFPYLEKAYFREQQFTEIFPHPADAKEALEKASALDHFEKDLLSGNTEAILKSIKDDSPKSFAKLADNYMTTLYKVDSEAHTHVVGNIIKQTIMSMVSQGRRSNNEALQTAANILNQFVFASSDFEPPTKLSGDEKPDEVDEEKEQLKRERSELVKARFAEVRDDLNTRVNNSIRSTIEQNIDPRNSMNDYVKKNAIRDAQENLESLINSDKRFKAITDKLWEKAFKENFTRTSIDTIRTAYTSKARTLLDSVIKKSRIEALRAMGKRVNTKDKNDDKSPRKGQSDNDERPRSKNKSGNSPTVPKGMSTLEFLMQDDD